MNEMKIKLLNPPPIDNGSIDKDTTNVNSEKEFQLCLPYKGGKGKSLTKKVQKTLNESLPENIVTRVVKTLTKLSSEFNVKDQTNFKHAHDLLYEVKCPDVNFNETYIGETCRRYNELICEYVGRDKNSHVLKHTLSSTNNPPSFDDFKNIGKGYRGNGYKRKVAEALLIKQLKPLLNIQEKSIPLKNFN